MNWNITPIHIVQTGRESTAQHQPRQQEQPGGFASLLQQAAGQQNPTRQDGFTGGRLPLNVELPVLWRRVRHVNKEVLSMLKK